MAQIMIPKLDNSSDTYVPNKEGVEEGKTSKYVQGIWQTIYFNFFPVGTHSPLQGMRYPFQIKDLELVLQIQDTHRRFDRVKSEGLTLSPTISLILSVDAGFLAAKLAFRMMTVVAKTANRKERLEILCACLCNQCGLHL